MIEIVEILPFSAFSSPHPWSTHGPHKGQSFEKDILLETLTLA
jgi:hypothetical protein